MEYEIHCTNYFGSSTLEKPQIYRECSATLHVYMKIYFVCSYSNALNSEKPQRLFCVAKLVISIDLQTVLNRILSVFNNKYLISCSAVVLQLPTC